MRILLIFPNNDRRSASLVHHPVMWSFSKKILTKLGKFPVTPSGGYLLPPTNLLVVAANTPPEVEVVFVDERIEEIDFDITVDLVGISVATAAATRAYEISKIFMEKGVPVVLGGLHPSLFPEDSVQYATSVVVGEVEGFWHEVLEDCRNKRLKKLYRSDQLPSLENLPAPRTDLLKDGYYMTKNVIETSRGCPYKCSFCTVSKFFGNKYRFRPVEDIVREIKERNLENQHLAFISDNVFGNKKYSDELFAALIPLNITWQGGATLSIGNHPDTLELAKKSGCRSLFIGFESLTTSNLKIIDKKQNQSAEEYPAMVKAIHKAKIGITGSFIIGLENDDQSIFKELSDFVYKNNIESVEMSTLIPYPGTAIYESLKKEDRILNYDWEDYNYTYISNEIVYKPNKMTAEELKAGYWKTHKKIFSTWSIFKRVILNGNFVYFYLPYNLTKKMRIHLI